MGRMERGLPCPYHSPARSETLGQAFTLHARSCKAVARSLPVATCLLQGTRRCSTTSRSVRRWPSLVAYRANPPNAHPFTNKVRPGR